MSQSFEVYRTSAGAGKTYNIVKEYIKLSFNDFGKFDSIAAITFTNKAANEMKERIISEVFHKITIPVEIFDHGQTGNTETFSGATITNPFGLFYQPYYRIKLRELSPYVESSSEIKIDNLPQNAKYYEKEKMWKWRDLYDHGYVDDDGNGTDYPFMNGLHYVLKDINFYLRNEEIFTNKSFGIYDFDKDRRKNKNNTSDPINC